MRTIFIIFLLFGIIGCSNSQSNTPDFNSFLSKYQNDEGIVSFTIPSFIANLVVDDKDQDAKKLLGKVNKLQFFISEHNNEYYTKAIKEYLPESSYHDLMVIKDGKETVVFKIKDPEDEKIKEILLMVSDADSFVVISFDGNFNLEEAKQMTGSINTKHFRQIRR